LRPRAPRALVELRRLPPRVAVFRARARRAAQAAGHDFALAAATSAGDTAVLIELARGAARMVELGTAAGWTAISLALAHPRLAVTTYDPVVHEHRDRYLGLAGEGARARIEFVRAPGSQGPGRPGAVGLLFIDSTHEQEATVAEFEAWQPHLAPGAAVAFHDYGHPDFPGVRSAVARLGLEGQVRGGMFVWRPLGG
jgi:predicted O-methyltransferase YrrM